MAFPGSTLRGLAHRVVGLVPRPQGIMPARSPCSTNTLPAASISNSCANPLGPQFGVTTLLGTSRSHSSPSTLRPSSSADAGVGALRLHSGASAMGSCSSSASHPSGDHPNAPAESVPRSNQTRELAYGSAASVHKNAVFSTAGNIKERQQRCEVVGSVTRSPTLMVRTADTVPCAHASLRFSLTEGIQIKPAAAVPLGFRVGAAASVASGRGQAHSTLGDVDATQMGGSGSALPHARAFLATVGGAGIVRMGSGSHMLGDLSQSVLVQRRSFAKRPKKWHGDPLRWVKVEEGQPVPPSQPNEGSIGGRNKAWRHLKRQVFKKVQHQTMQAQVAAANRAKAAKNYVKWKASIIRSQIKKKAAARAAAVAAAGSS